MTARSLIDRILQQEDLNFLLTNRIPRRWLNPVRGLVEPASNSHGYARPASRCGACFRIST